MSNTRIVIGAGAASVSGVMFMLKDTLILPAALPR